MRVACLAVTALLLAPAVRAEDIAQPRACAATPAALTAKDYPVAPHKGQDGGAAEFDFASFAHCLAVGDAQVPALLIRVAQPRATPTLHVTSVSANDATLPAQVEVLDETFSPRRKYPFDRFNKRGMHYTMTVFLDDGSGPVYLLVTPDREWLGRNSHTVSGNRWSTIWTTGSVVGTLSNGFESRKDIPFGAAGTLRIEAEQDDRIVHPPSHH